MTFPEYLYFLLPSALKKVGKKLNQYWILCKVLGKRFAKLKETILDIREMSMLISCPQELLPVIGQERGMPRLKGEDIELYRRRLLRKYEIAKTAGTNPGIIAAIKALGYENVCIEPLYKIDPIRWAEAIAWISGGGIVIDDREIIQQIINEVKPASALVTLAQEQIYSGNIYFGAYTEIVKIIDTRQV